MKMILRLALLCFAPLLFVGCGADNKTEVPEVIAPQPEDQPSGEATEPENPGTEDTDTDTDQ